MVPPGEAAGVRSPPGDVDVHEARVEQPGERLPLPGRHVDRPDERVRVEHVAVGGRDVHVAGDDEAGVVVAPAAGPLGQGGDEVELEVVVPVPDGPPVGDVDRHHPHRLGAVDQAADDAGVAVEVLVAQVARGQHVADRVAGDHGHAVVAAAPDVHGAVAVPGEGRGGGVGQRGRLRLLQAEDVGGDPLEEPLDRCEPGPQRVQVPRRYPQPTGGRPGGRHRRAPGQRGLAAFEPRRMRPRRGRHGVVHGPGVPGGRPSTHIGAGVGHGLSRTSAPRVTVSPGPAAAPAGGRWCGTGWGWYPSPPRTGCGSSPPSRSPPAGPPRPPAGRWSPAARGPSTAAGARASGGGSGRGVRPCAVRSCAGSCGRARPALPTDRSSSRCSRAHASARPRSSSVGASGTGIGTYCACPPERCGATTSARATALAAAAPSRRRTRCRQQSSPAELPAEVTIVPSSTHRRSCSTVTAGWSRPSSPVQLQWVVARRPSSRPAPARAKAPTHSPTTVAPASWCRTRNPATTGSTGRSGSHQVGTTTRSAPCAARIVPGGVRRSPPVEARGPSSGLHTTTSRSGRPASRAAQVNTATAPASSNSEPPSTATMATLPLGVRSPTPLRPRSPTWRLPG